MGEQHLEGVAGAETAWTLRTEHQRGVAGRDHGLEMVTITVNNEPVEIHRGRQTVSEIKRLGGVPAADELAQVIEGEPLKPLPDDGSVVLKGGEEFVSYPKDSSSSFGEAVEGGSAVAISDDEVRELIRQYPEMKEGTEAGVTYYLIPGLRLPEGCMPDRVDALLCPTSRDGYPSRLFLEKAVTCRKARNWNASNVRILERNWFAVSWRVSTPNLRLAQLLAAHLEAFR